MFCSSIHDNKLSPLCGKAGLPPRAARFSQFLTRPALFAAAALSIGLASGGKIPGLHEACSAEYTWGSTSGNAWTWGPGSSAGWASGTPADAWDAGQANTAIFNWSGNHNTTITLTGDIHLATLWLKGNNGGNPISFTGGSLQFGANQGLIDATGITVNGGWYYIGTPLVGTGGLVLRSHVLANDGSTGLLRLNGNNFGLTGGITIEKGYVVPDTPAAFGGNVITLDGGGIGIYTAFYGYNNPILNDIVIGPNGGSFRTWNSNECYGIFNGTISGTGALTIGAGKVAGDIRFSGDWQHTGNINLVAGHISFAPAAGEVMEINNKISGNGGVRIAGQGVVRLTNMNSTFLGAEPNTDNRSSVYIYSGATLEVEDFGNTTSGPLGPNLNRGTVNNRDAHRNLIAMENGATLRYTGTGAGVLDRNIRRMPGGDVVAIIDVVEPTATLLLSYVSGF